MDVVAQPVEPLNFAKPIFQGSLGEGAIPGVLQGPSYASTRRASPDISVSGTQEIPSLSSTSRRDVVNSLLTFEQVDPDLATVASALSNMPLYGISDRLVSMLHASGKVLQSRNSDAPIFGAQAVNTYTSRGQMGMLGEKALLQTEKDATSPWGNWGRPSSAVSTLKVAAMVTSENSEDTKG